MINSLIFDNNKMSEIIIRNFLINSKIVISESHCNFVEFKDLMESIEHHDPDYIIIDFELYHNFLKEIIEGVRKTTPQCKIIIVTNRITNRDRELLNKQGIVATFTRPFVDADFISVLIN